MFESMTKKDFESHLSAIGVTGDAANAILKETAPMRHNARVEQARTAVRDYYRRTVENPCPGYVYVDSLSVDSAEERDMRAEYVFIALLDAMGVGGRMGVEGLSTDRHPAFSKCGSGRKHAGDGPAWSAAIESLITNPPEHAKWDFSAYTQRSIAEDGTETIFWALGIEAGNDGVPCTHAAVDHDESDAAWKLTLAREGLRISVGLAPWHSGPFMDLFDWSSLSPEQWAGLVNHYTAVVEQNNKPAFGDSIEEIRAAREAAELCLTSPHPSHFSPSA